MSTGLREIVSSVFKRIENSEIVKEAVRQTESERDAKRSELMARRVAIEKESVASAAEAQKKVESLRPKQEKAKAEFLAIDKAFREAKLAEDHINLVRDGQRDKIDRELFDLRPECIQRFLDQLDNEMTRIRTGTSVSFSKKFYSIERNTTTDRVIETNRPSRESRLSGVIQLRREIADEWHKSAKTAEELQADFDEAYGKLCDDTVMVNTGVE